MTVLRTISLSVLFFLVALTCPGIVRAEALNDGPVYPIRWFRLAYLRDNPAQPPLQQIALIPITLAATDTGFVAPRPGLPAVTQTLAGFCSDTAQNFHASAVQTILETIRDYYTSRRFLGIFVAPDPDQIDNQGHDLRPADQLDLRLLITLSGATRVRTLAQGERIPTTQRINNPAHARILADSPVQPQVEENSDATAANLLRQDLLDDYVLRLSRHPGRRVDLALAPAPELGGVALDYLITESKPWLIYAQLANTGTSNTNRLREQFGFRSYQLTNHDDILALDYSTTGFEKSHAVNTSYEAPLGDAPRLRWKIFGSWNKYTAADIGLSSNTFTGDSWDLGGQLSANIYQAGPLFIDLLAGARFESIHTANTLPGSTPGAADFVLPMCGLRAERRTDWASFFASVDTEMQFSNLNNSDRDELANLGKTRVDTNWMLLHWDVSQSVYLEPLLNRSAWQDPASRAATLAHELFLGVRGQSALGRRIIPQMEMVAGGLYTVRGYPEAVVAGDDTLIGTLEYRLHVPKLFALESEPRKLFSQPFRYAPQQAYGPTDWDLILRTFLDAGLVRSVGAEGIPETNTTLVGTGVGVEIQYQRNLTFRCDWGFAVNGLVDNVSSGSQQVHFVLTVLY